MTVALEAGLVAREPGTLCAFYTGVMRFTLVERLEHPVGTVYKLRRDAARLKIFSSVEAIDPVATTEPWFTPGGWRYAALSLDTFADVDELVAAVDASTGRVLIAPTNHRDGARMALVCDPEGNVWELLAEA
jgi:predicted enzyme related to lactoylglutathione lyase